MSYYLKNRGTKHGNYMPKNPNKYVGSYPIVVRSSWERLFFQWVDLSPSIKEWSAESAFIRYYDPIRQKVRRYYPDAYIKTIDGNRYIIEIKPEKETRMPKKKGKKSDKTLAIREQTYITNKAKFEAAKEYCRKMGMEFKILTEKNLFTESKK